MADTPTPKHRGKVRSCWNCGADMGFIENRYYDRMDTCGSAECLREERDAARAERDDAHDQLDRDRGDY